MSNVQMNLEGRLSGLKKLRDSNFKKIIFTIDAISWRKLQNTLEREIRVVFYALLKEIPVTWKKKTLKLYTMTAVVSD